MNLWRMAVFISSLNQFDLLVVFNSSKLKTVIELLEVQLIDLVELLNLLVSQLAEVSLHQLAVRHVQLVRVEPLGLEDIWTQNSSSILSSRQNKSPT